MDNQEAIDKVFNSLRNLPQYRNKPEAELMAIAKHKVEQDEADIDIVGKFKNLAEKKIAKSLQNKYLEDYEIETVSDKNTLKEVIYLEVIQNRLQEKLNDFYETDNKAVPFNLIEIIHKNSDAIIRLKNTLGLNRSKEKRSSYDVLEHLKKRFKKWLFENQASRTLSCPHCGKMILLKIRTAIWEAQKHPFFRDKVLYNKHLMHMLHTGQITRDDVGKVLEQSPDMCDWIIDKIENPNANKQQVK